MDDDKFKRLLQGYLNETLTSAELRAFLQAIAQEGFEEILSLHLDQKLNERGMEDPLLTEISLAAFKERLAQRVEISYAPQPAIRKIHWLRTSFKYAAALALVALTGVVLWLATGKKNGSRKEPGKATQIIASTDHRPLLILANDQTIALDSQAAGSKLLASVGIHFMADSSRLVYETSGRGRPAAGSHKLLTGYGSQCSVVLPDGSRVWLNALSSLRYSASFTGPRSVELSGEAYFEVNGHPDQPFLVKSGTATITVLGTAFNVRAYPEDSSVTAGVYQGRVQLSSGGKRSVIRGGQQVIIYNSGEWQLQDPETMQAAIGWKDNYFDFKKAPLQKIMAELSHWYNIKYRIDPGVHRTFSGKIPRTEDLPTVLEVLKESGITYRNDGDLFVFFR